MVVVVRLILQFHLAVKIPQEGVSQVQHRMTNNKLYKDHSTPP